MSYKSFLKNEISDSVIIDRAKGQGFVVHGIEMSFGKEVEIIFTCEFTVTGTEFILTLRSSSVFIDILTIISGKYTDFWDREEHFCEYDGYSLEYEQL